MNPKQTWIWAVIAATLFAFIFFFERNLKQPPPGPQPLLPELKAAAVTKFIVQHAGQPEIRAERTNGSWVIVKSNALPAQASAIEATLATLERLVPATHLPTRDLQARSRSEEEFGVDNPRTTLVILEGQRRTQMNIGALTAPGDQVYVRVVGQPDVCVVDAELLKLLPATTSDWRDSALVDLRKLIFDELVVSNASGIIRLQREITNSTWRIRKPLETGADGGRIEDALQKLQLVRVTQFISDDPRTDLESIGLQPPVFELSFRAGTNTTAVLHFGKTLTNVPGQIFAQRDSSVVCVPADLLSAWNLHFSNFRDRQLFALPADFGEIELRGAESFTLQRSSSNAWKIAGEKFPVDTALVDSFLNALAGMEIPLPDGFVKDKATAVEFARYGLTSPVRQIIFKLPSGSAATNPVLKQVSFGIQAGGTNENVYARRGDEDSIFAIPAGDFQQLPAFAWQLRDQRLWNFPSTDVVRIVVRQDGKAREFIRSGTNSWALGAGSEGVVETEPLEEIVHRFGELRATAWAARGDAARDARFGFKTNNLALTFELRSGPKLDLQFGGLSPAKYPYALVMFDGEPWAFEFSTALYQFMSVHLKIFLDRP